MVAWLKIDVKRWRKKMMYTIQKKEKDKGEKLKKRRQKSVIQIIKKKTR